MPALASRARNGAVQIPDCTAQAGRLFPVIDSTRQVHSPDSQNAQ
jgi:hypothetical protein